MSGDYKDSKFKNWLEQLQQESWQLELIISGFAIYGLLMAFDPLLVLAKEGENQQHIYQLVLALVALISCAILLFNLILHVILRGLWIGALGLRYVSGDIEYDRLKYSKLFRNYLEKRIGSFDKYIASLEDYCSVLFAISFLLIFYTLSIFIFVIVLVSIANFMIESGRPWLKTTGIISLLFVVLGGLLTFVDFISQGLLKRFKWVSRFYFPFYWIFSFITLSFLYRPLVYNFLDNRFGKRLSFLLVPMYAFVVFLVSLEMRASNYLSPEANSNEIHADYRNYEDQLSAPDRFMRIATIPSKVIETKYLKIFIAHSENLENQILAYNPSLKPEKDKRGLSANSIFSDDTYNYSGQDRKNRLAFVRTFNEMYSLGIDSLRMDSDFVVTQNQKGQLGFETYADISSLDQGRHQLKILRKRIKEKDTITLRVLSVPFWYYP